MGKFAPVEVEVGQEKVEAGEHQEHKGEVGIGYVVEGGDGAGDAGDDEVEREDVGADHPLAMGDELPVARGDESSQGAEEPQRRHDAVGEGEGVVPVKLQDQRDRCRDSDADDVGAAHDAVAFKVSLAKTGGEEEGSEDSRDGSADGVRDEEDHLLDELGAVRAGGVEERDVEIENEDSGERDGGPEDGLGEGAGGAGTRQRRRGSRHVAPVGLEVWVQGRLRICVECIAWSRSKNAARVKPMKLSLLPRRTLYPRIGIQTQ